MGKWYLILHRLHCNLCPNFHKNKPFTDILYTNHYKYIFVYPTQLFPGKNSIIFYIHLYTNHQIITSIRF